jgi:transcription initiation factor TFIIIB Brf1 subunit/transcription initiation factor TFIIB
MIIQSRNHDLDEDTWNMVLNTITESYGMDKKYIFARTRSPKHIMARAMLVKLLRDTLMVSYRVIAERIQRDKRNIARMYRAHDRYYCLNYYGYRWDFLEISTEFTGRYYHENGRKAEEGRG